MHGRADADVGRVSPSVPPPGMEVSATPPAPDPPAPMRGRARRRGRAIGAAAALAGLVAAAFALFGSASSQLTDPVAQAAVRSTGMPGYRLRMSLQLTSSALPTPITGYASGVADLRDHATSLSMVMNMDQPQITQLLGTSSLNLAMVTQGSVMYMKLPAALTSRLPGGGRPWIKVNLAKLPGLSGLSTLESNPISTDPGQMLQYLRAASNSVASEGRERVDGVITRHYRADLSFDRVAGAVPAADRAAMQQMASMVERVTGVHDLPVDVWIDAHRLVRRTAMTISLNLPTGQSLQESVVVDLSHYGPQRRPSPPPADEVQDLSGLASAATG